MSNRTSFVNEIVKSVKSMADSTPYDESCDKMNAYIDETTKNILTQFISSGNEAGSDEMSSPFAFSVACLRAAYIINMIVCTDKLGSKSETAKAVLAAITEMLSPEDANMSPDGKIL